MKDSKKQKKQPIRKAGKLSRRDAMTKMSLATFSAATMLLLLNRPGKVQAQDSSTMPGDPGDF